MSNKRMGRSIARRPARGLLGLALAGCTVLGLASPSGAEAPTPSTSDKWGVISRNTIGSPSAFLRDGPFGRTSTDPSARQSPPYGQGSLQLIVGDGTEKIAFGNETNFDGLRLANINTLTYWVFAGMDSLTGIALPGVYLEVDPNLTPEVNYSSLVYLPGDSTTPSSPGTPLPNVWQRYNASTTNSAWYATGATGSAIGCTLATPCSFSELKSRLPDAEVSFSLGITKGRDTAFIGAVDGLQVNNLVYDFERLGVFTKAPLPTQQTG
ncbi:hypothetical protein FHX41_3761 [Actinomadura hallensis]|uniref:Uncharacterized protein n=1 Tax=Actinomadura hallensis TaxID=337895 RepID=A0A543IHK7_9ACTN|nr:hypothetical protein [Actinomadura hallensis]TQM70042.1 hypothetical protein FHX41_3761 [Actinomadura hallensis]